MVIAGASSPLSLRLALLHVIIHNCLRPVILLDGSACPMACWRGGEGGSGSIQEPSINSWSSWEVLFLRRCAGRMQSRAMCWSFSCGQLLLRRRWIRWLSWPKKLRRWRALRRAWSKMRRRLLTLCRDQSVRVVVGLSEGGLRRGGCRGTFANFALAFAARAFTHALAFTNWSLL